MYYHLISNTRSWHKTEILCERIFAEWWRCINGESSFYNMVWYVWYGIIWYDVIQSIFTINFYYKKMNQITFLPIERDV